jgi:single-stranded DNA-binding protein
MDTIKGSLRNDPDMNYTTTGLAVTKFRIYEDIGQHYDDDKRIVVWSELAELAEEILRENDEVYIKGYWKDRSWISSSTKEEVKIREFIAKDGIWLIENGQPKDITKIQDDPTSKYFKSGDAK